MNPEQFEKYQYFTEKTINDLSHKITLLENKLNMFTNLLEISKYINQYIKDPNLLTIINDMLIGVFGAKYSTIYIKLNDEYEEAGASKLSYTFIEAGKKLIYEHKEEKFIINSDTPIYGEDMEEESIHSSLGIPIYVENRLLGFILIQHININYFVEDHAIFLSSIGNHIGVALENNLLYRQIKDSANLDGLTELYNKRYFFKTLNSMVDLKEEDYSIVMIDLDNFKTINDNYGHPCGDMALINVANIMKEMTRSNDIVARYGGDEFIIYFNNFTDREKVMHRLEMIRREIESYQIQGEEESFTVTASFGVYCKQNEILSLEEVIKKADKNLYLSKATGKNIVSMNQNKND
ncbi:sensor domain-containing diguanylate cyclase [Mobilitalea sibirica]|uniref:Sensor domain-containing diguanylate cyclase n=1 Tax=Mobilitalea sibirica TaxID=1462919 RepID=A0A8J7H112_9FIRM|nr:sensor domain-containing diguanylate cyclase [Mobilitalea sibirica]MBH1939943.1 sensor domain-containing diguanylate cyclase [Mobilitalea sibirica]